MSRSSRTRLQLTWPNKDRRLLPHGADTYEWVDPTDWRVAEVRLLHEAGTHGENPGDNLLIHGDALYALGSLANLPDHAERYVGKVKLVYIDPPFNTGQTFAHYDDAVEHSVWLTLLRDRLVQVKRLLSPDGSVWVHLDDAEQHRARVVLDEVFGAENFVATVIWEKTDSPRMDAKLFSTRHDYIHVYRKSTAFTMRRLPGGKSNANKVTDDGRPYYLKPLRASGGQGSTREARPNLYFAMEAPDGTQVFPKLPDGGDGAWRWGQDKVKRDADEIEWVDGRKGWNPYFRVYETTDRSRPAETLWRFDEVGSTRNSASESKKLFGGAFATPKPERLLERILFLATNPGDIVLDCFAGSGTTAAVAHKMGRRWVTVELLDATVAKFVRPRLTKVADGDDPNGITEAVAWEGGGGFTELVVGPSMFEDYEGVVVLSEWATGGALAEGVAAQLRFTYAPDGPFAGRKGKTRLAVIDGMLTVALADYLLAELDDGEKLRVVAQALEPGVDEYLRGKRSGSRAQKVPADLAHIGRRPTGFVVLNSDGSSANDSTGDGDEA